MTTTTVAAQSAPAAAAYEMGVRYAGEYSPVDLGREIAYLERKIPAADPLSAEMFRGIRDTLAKRAEVAS